MGCPTRPSRSSLNQVTDRKFGVFSPHSEGLAPNLASEARSSPATLFKRGSSSWERVVQRVRIRAAEGLFVLLRQGLWRRADAG